PPTPCQRPAAYLGKRRNLPSGAAGMRFAPLHLHSSCLVAKWFCGSRRGWSEAAAALNITHRMYLGSRDVHGQFHQTVGNDRCTYSAARRRRATAPNTTQLPLTADMIVFSMA